MLRYGYDRRLATSGSRVGTLAQIIRLRQCSSC
jgi:TRAP-type mannitol/chloroaromatic compound transport system permease large subunit